MLEITPERARAVPILDLTRLALAGMLRAAWNVFWVTRTIQADWGQSRG